MQQDDGAIRQSRAASRISIIISQRLVRASIRSPNAPRRLSTRRRQLVSLSLFDHFRCVSFVSFDEWTVARRDTIARRRRRRHRNNNSSRTRCLHRPSLSTRFAIESARDCEFKHRNQSGDGGATIGARGAAATRHGSKTRGLFGQFVRGIIDERVCVFRWRRRSRVWRYSNSDVASRPCKSLARTLWLSLCACDI
jgi:hypothetical protein